MKNFILVLSGIFMCLVFMVGCSGGNQPVIPNDDSQLIAEIDTITIGVSDSYSDGSPSGGMGTLGLFQIHLDPENITGEITSLRKTALPDVLEVVDITSFLKLAPCTDCVKLQSVSLNEDGNLVASIGIKHPFEEGDPFKPITGKNRGDLHVFNVEGIIVSNNLATNFSGIGRQVADFRLLNASGYTGYLDIALDSIYPTDADIHPYILHFDDYSSGNFDPNNPMGFEHVTIPHPSGNLVMPMGSDYDFKDYIFDIDGSMDFIFAVGCTYAVSSATKSQRFNPEYRVPQHNKKAASEIWVEIVENELMAGDEESSATLQIHVVDISHGVPVGDALNEMLADSSVSGISVEVPGVTQTSVSFSTDPVSGTGHDPSDPLIYQGVITNSATGDEGIYMGLVKVTDSYQPGLNTSPLLDGMDGIERVDPVVNPLEGLFAIPEFATYQLFTIDISDTFAEIIVTRPNGGEDWLVASDEEITWESEGVTGTVFIEYSKDDFASDINLIAEDVPNTGTYLWQNIPEDPSETVRVRVSSTVNSDIYGISDEYFTIYMIHIGWFRNWGPNAFTGGKGVAVDHDGNSYVTGKFMGTIDFNPDPNENDFQTSNGGYDVYVAKFNRHGVYQWARTWGGSGWEYNRGVAVDNNGNVFVPGYFMGSVDFDPDPNNYEIRNSVGPRDAFLSKFDTDGNFIWVGTWGGVRNDDAYGAETDEFGNVYVTGHFSGTADFDPGPGTEYRTSNGSYDAYLSKLDSEGNLLWVHTYGGSQWDYGHDITVDSYGDVYNVGWFGGTVDFDPGSGTDYRTAEGEFNCGVYLIKFNHQGDYQWVRTWGGSNRNNYDFGIGVNSDLNSNIYVAGRFVGTVDFDPGSGTDEHTANGDVDAFLTSFTHNGDFRWAHTWGAINDDYARGVACDHHGNVYVGGHFQNTVDFNPDPGASEYRTSRHRDVYLSKFDTNGNFIWVRAFGGTGNDRTGMVDVDRFGNVFFTGIFQGSGNVAPDNPPCNEDPLYRSSSGECDAFLVKYLPDGCWNDD